MVRPEILVIRILLSGLFALLISRFFFSETTLFNTGGLALILLFAAYVIEYFKNREKD